MPNQIIRFIRSINNSVGLLSFGLPAVTQLPNSQLKLYVGGSNENPVLINTPPFQKQFRKTFGTAVNIANNATYNLVSQLLLTDVPANSEANMENFPSKFSINSTLQSLIFPKLKYYCKYDIRISFFGTVTGTAGSDRQFTVRLRRGDNTLVGEKYAIKLDLLPLDPMITEFTSFTRSDLSIDPYSNINNGLKIEIVNNSGTALTLSGFDLVFQGIPTNNEEF